MWPLFPQSTPAIRPSLTLFFYLVGAFLLALLPHVQQLPLWITVTILVAMGFRSLIELYRWRLPSPAFCAVVALCFFSAVYLQFHTVLGRDAGTALMALLLAVKFYELRSPRDTALIIFCCFFVVISSLLYSQALELFVYCLIMMWVLTALLLRTSMGDLSTNRLIPLLRASGLILLQAVPLALFLFFFFPRFHGSLQLNMDDSSIGLTDVLQPGSISRLSEDDSTAMTVKLTGQALPTPETMYWRALVLWNYQKGTWTRGDVAFPPLDESQALPQPQPKSNDAISQEITIFAHFHRWLFALDYPVTKAEPLDGANDWSEVLNGDVLQLKNSNALDEMQRYNVTSSPLLAPQTLNEALKNAALELPHGKDDAIDPGVQALAAQLNEGCVTEEDHIRAVLHYFRREGFIYSSSPGTGPGGEQGMANFLLRRKKGFCEHYASAFALLMRLGHIPCRVVVGYYGAQYNPYKNLYVVKQSNAHSWDEVWLDRQKQWERVDPTSVLSGSDNQTLAASDQAREGPDESLSIQLAHHRVTFVSGAALPSWLRRGILEMQLRRQEVEADWDDWVFSYDPQTQSRWAQALGLGRQAGAALALLCLLAVFLCGITFGWLMQRRTPRSAVETSYGKLCRTLAHRGFPRADWEGPLAYTDRMGKAFPEKRAALQRLGHLVAEDRYAPTRPPVSRHELTELLK